MFCGCWWLYYCKFPQGVLNGFGVMWLLHRSSHFGSGNPSRFQFGKWGAQFFQLSAHCFRLFPILAVLAPHVAHVAMIWSSCHDGVMMRTEICWLMRSHQVLGGYGGLHAVVLAGHSRALRWGKAAELHFGFWISFGWSWDGFRMATNASWLPDHHVLGDQRKLAARSSCFWLPVQAGCQVTMFLATSASWLPDHHVSGYQRKLAARSRCFWLPVQADCQIIMFLATSASWLPGHDVSGYQCKLAARSRCFWLPVQTSQRRWLWGGWGALVGFWQHCCQGGRSLEENKSKL